MKLLLIIISYILLLAAPVMAANSERNFGGVGIDGIPLPDGQIRVRQLVIAGPAHRAGIRIGDVITHIDGKATKGSDFQAMVQTRLRGIAGTPVVLKIKREGGEKPLLFTLTRRQIAMPASKER
jgi:C-terminal processing protease CtpA/Prc